MLTNLTFVDIAVEELKPSYMRGSGAVPEDAVGELNGVVHELRSLITAMERYLKQEFTTDLEKRLEQLEVAGADMELLRLLEKIVTRNGLVECRPRIDALAARLEEDNFEVALFGRVSSGKSSLLNALLGTDVLPVGVNPILRARTISTFSEGASRMELCSSNSRRARSSDFFSLFSEADRNLIRPGASSYL